MKVEFPEEGGVVITEATKEEMCCCECGGTRTEPHQKEISQGTNIDTGNRLFMFKADIDPTILYFIENKKKVICKVCMMMHEAEWLVDHPCYMIREIREKSPEPDVPTGWIAESLMLF